MIEIRNSGKKPVPVGYTRERFPIVLQAGKSMKVEKTLAEQLCSKYNYVNKEKPQEVKKEKKDKQK